MDNLEIYLLLLIILYVASYAATLGLAYMEYKQLRMPKYLLVVGAFSFIYPSLGWFVLALLVGRILQKRWPERASLISIKKIFAVLVLVQLIVVNVVVSALNSLAVDPLYEEELSLVSALFCNVLLMCFGLWLNSRLNRSLLEY